MIIFEDLEQVLDFLRRELNIRHKFFGSIFIFLPELKFLKRS